MPLTSYSIIFNTSPLLYHSSTVSLPSTNSPNWCLIVSSTAPLPLTLSYSTPFSQSGRILHCTQLCYLHSSYPSPQSNPNSSNSAGVTSRTRNACRVKSARFHLLSPIHSVFHWAPRPFPLPSSPATLSRCAATPGPPVATLFKTVPTARASPVCAAQPTAHFYTLYLVNL